MIQRIPEDDARKTEKFKELLRNVLEAQSDDEIEFQRIGRLQPRTSQFWPAFSVVLLLLTSALSWSWYESDRELEELQSKVEPFQALVSKVEEFDSGSCPWQEVRDAVARVSGLRVNR